MNEKLTPKELEAKVDEMFKESDIAVFALYAAIVEKFRTK